MQRQYGLYTATKTIKGKHRLLRKGETILLKRSKAQPLVEKGMLVEVNPQVAAKKIREELLSVGGEIEVFSKVLNEKIKFSCYPGRNSSVVTYTPEELAQIMLQKPDENSIRIIHLTKKIFRAKVVA